VKTNPKLPVAMRRNAQMREGQAFLDQLVVRTGLSRADISLLDPAYSIELETRVYARIERGVGDGSVLRRSGLSLDDAVGCCHEWARSTSPEELDVLFCHYPHFSIRSRAAPLLSALPALIELDGDTVTAVMQGRDAGFALDYEGEVAGRRTYECDTWDGDHRS
jgi:hypothetical protein